VTFSIDTGAPTVNITYPQNITYNINVSELNYTASNGGSGLEKCWYSTDDGGTNSTPVTPGTNFTNNKFHKCNKCRRKQYLDNMV
jgi:hypothetical protein